MTETGGAAGLSWPRRHAVALLSAAALALGVLGTVGITQLVKSHPTAAPAQAQYLPPIGRQLTPAAPFVLKDQAGQSVSLASLRGQTVLLAFLDPLCKNVCPIMGQELAALERGLPPGKTPALVIISVAADRTPVDVNHFVAKVTWRPGWHWLLGSQAQLAPVWAAYHVFVDASAADVVHDAVLLIIDPKGRISTEYNAPLPLTEVNTSLKAADAAQ